MPPSLLKLLESQEAATLLRWHNCDDVSRDVYQTKEGPACIFETDICRILADIGFAIGRLPRRRCHDPRHSSHALSAVGNDVRHVLSFL